MPDEPTSRVDSALCDQLGPAAWQMPHEKLGHLMTIGATELLKQPEWVKQKWQHAAPLYDRAAIDAAVAAERERLVERTERRRAG